MIRELAPEYGYKPEEIEIQLIGVGQRKIREELMTESEQRKAQTEDTLVVTPEIKELSHVQEYCSDLLLEKR